MARLRRHGQRQRRPARFTWRSPPEVCWAAFSLALVAPLVFNRVVEYPLAVILACLVAPAAEPAHAGMAFRSVVTICFFQASCFS